ncbi:MAG TPA: DUF1802 family protein [Thermoanaerobaculia bacterium]|nr:DUF1802 family protein [Thermoanaerobaculia bacterium]
MNTLPNHLALKEWSSVVAALGTGEQVILIRKGGIADPTFGLEGQRFYLYPTYFHQGEAEARSSITITLWCEAVRTWSIRDLDLLYRLAPLSVMPRATLDARYRFRPDQALNVIALRTWKLADAVDIAFKDKYAGCLSWISLDDEIDIDGSTPVLTHAQLDAKIESVEARLTVAV